MAVAALFWMILAVLVVIGIICVVVSSRGNGLNRSQRQELRDAKALIKSIERTCIEYRESAPNLSDIIRSDIDNFNLKELNP